MDRTDRRLLLAIRLVIIPGFLAATYLTYTKLFDKAIACGTGGCEVIANSRWSEVLGIPVTIIGMAAYITLFGATFIKGDAGKLTAAFVAVCGIAFSAFLQYQALVVIGHFCPYCFVSATCMFLLAILTIWRVVRLPKFPDATSDSELAAT